MRNEASWAVFWNPWVHLVLWGRSSTEIIKDFYVLWWLYEASLKEVCDEKNLRWKFCPIQTVCKTHCSLLVFEKCWPHSICVTVLLQNWGSFALLMKLSCLILLCIWQFLIGRIPGNPLISRFSSKDLGPFIRMFWAGVVVGMERGGRGDMAVEYWKWKVVSMLSHFPGRYLSSNPARMVLHFLAFIHWLEVLWAYNTVYRQVWCSRERLLFLKLRFKGWITGSIIF